MTIDALASFGVIIAAVAPTQPAATMTTAWSRRCCQPWG
jgi:hypothetical protein